MHCNYLLFRRCCGNDQPHRSVGACNYVQWSNVSNHSLILIQILIMDRMILFMQESHHWIFEINGSMAPCVSKCAIFQYHVPLSCLLHRTKRIYPENTSWNQTCIPSSGEDCHEKWKKWDYSNSNQIHYNLCNSYLLLDVFGWLL